MSGRRGFTLLEVLVVATIVAVLAALAADLFSGARLERLEAAIRILENDMAYGRSRAIAAPADPIMLRFDADGKGYHLARASMPDVAISGPNGPLRVRFGENRAASAAGARVSATGSRDLVFGPFGGVMDPVPTIRVSLDGGPEYSTVALDPFTGDCAVVYQSR